jgi:hypothetical protein
LIYLDSCALVKLARPERETGALRAWLSGRPRPVVASAALGDPALRSLDAVHLATALRLDVPTLEFVTYDRRLSCAASDEGLAVAAPA